MQTEQQKLINSDYVLHSTFSCRFLNNRRPPLNFFLKKYPWQRWKIHDLKKYSSVPFTFITPCIYQSVLNTIRLVPYVRNVYNLFANCTVTNNCTIALKLVLYVFIYFKFANILKQLCLVNYVLLNLILYIWNYKHLQL